jgi:hypothetical protein
LPDFNDNGEIDFISLIGSHQPFNMINFIYSHMLMDINIENEEYVLGLNDVNVIQKKEKNDIVIRKENESVFVAGSKYFSKSSCEDLFFDEISNPTKYHYFCEKYLLYFRKGQDWMNLFPQVVTSNSSENNLVNSWFWKYNYNSLLFSFDNFEFSLRSPLCSGELNRQLSFTILSYLCKFSQLNQNNLLMSLFSSVNNKYVVSHDITKKYLILNNFPSISYIFYEILNDTTLNSPLNDVSNNSGGDNVNDLSYSDNNQCISLPTPEFFTSLPSFSVDVFFF